MVENEVMAWAKMYFYTSLGLVEPNRVVLEEQFILDTFQEQFVYPYNVLQGNDYGHIMTREEIVYFMQTIKMLKLSKMFHLLGKLVSVGYLQRDEDLATTLQSGWNNFMQDHTEMYGVVKGGKPFKCYVDYKEELIGNYHIPVALLGQVSHFPKGLNLNVLMNQSPIRLNDYSVQALRSAVKSGVIDEGFLMMEKYLVPTDSGFVEKYVTAVTPELPPYFVRQLISNLPQATINDVGNPYVAALRFAEDNPVEYRTALRELKEIFAHQQEVSPQIPQLTDSIVLEYLSNKYGASPEELREKLFVPTVDKLYTSAYLLDSANRDMTVEEFVSYAAENPSATSGTLDEIITAFCTEENFDKSRSVEDLISFINDEPMQEPDIPKLLSEFVRSNDIPTNITLKQFITGESSPTDDLNNAVTALRESNLFTDTFMRVVENAISQNQVAEYSTVIDVIERIKMPEELRENLKYAASTNKEVVIPEKEITEAQVTDYLTRAGIPRVQANKLSSGVLDTDSIIAGFLIELGVSEDEAFKLIESKQLTREMVDNLLPETEVKDVRNIRQDFDDNAYLAAESLLYNIRKVITENDSLELRTTLLPIVYSFTRLLMMSLGDERNVTEFLRSNEEGCTDAATSYIEQAIGLLTQSK